MSSYAQSIFIYVYFSLPTYSIQTILSYSSRPGNLPHPANSILSIYHIFIISFYKSSFIHPILIFPFYSSHPSHSILLIPTYLLTHYSLLFTPPNLLTQPIHLILLIRTFLPNQYISFYSSQPDYPTITSHFTHPILIIQPLHLILLIPT